MGLASFLPLGLFVISATITPGGATTMATASGAHFGFRKSLPVLSGIAVGLASMAAAAGCGLAALLLAAPTLQLVMKAMGSLYLLWLAWKMGRAGAPKSAGTGSKPLTFIGGVWMLWHNPKGWAVTVGAAASFGSIVAGPVHLALVLALAFGIASSLSLGLWCAAGQVLARLLRSEIQWRAVNVLLACLLVASIIPMWLK
ncbi:LysE family translocator [Robbsia sp. KACC 23696]|uniref:LysE family translocator n=1 Tax=Robbsia sp. KACC 23696 TaxID=3149231 RepID=UPI00325AF253